MPLKTHDEYFASQPAELRERLVQIQGAVERQVEGATRTIAYGMPAFRQGRVFFYFAAFKHHIGIYPPVTEDLQLIEETRAFRGPKGNLSFAHDLALPLPLIARAARALAAQYAAK